MVIYLSNSVKGLRKDNFFRDLARLSVPIPFKLLVYLLDLRRFRKNLPKDVMARRDLLVDALLVSLVSYKLRFSSKDSLSGVEMLYYSLGEYENYLKRILRGMFTNRKDITMLPGDVVQSLAKKILNLQLKKGLFKLKDGKLIPTKKWEKLKKDLTPFIEYLID
ncbi:MAG: hypothetical protein J7K73_01630 [Nanoarchaeota archaeon]|nr:hypothetical protein [Nanoarchaeota archaeon]